MHSVKVGRPGLKSKDFINQMPEEVLLVILSLLSLKDAVVTGAVSPKDGNSCGASYTNWNSMLVKH